MRDRARGLDDDDDLVNRRDHDPQAQDRLQVPHQPYHDWTTVVIVMVVVVVVSPVLVEVPHGRGRGRGRGREHEHERDCTRRDSQQ